MIIKYLIEKEFKQLARNPFILFIVIILPVLVMLVFPWATTMEIKNVNVAVVDNDRSDLSRLLTEKIASTEYFDIVGVFMRSEDALEKVEFSDADIILEVPYGFEQALMSEGESSLLIEANAVNGTKASLGSSYLDMIVLDFTEEVNLERGAVSVLPAGGIGVDSYYWFNPTMDYKIPMIPALIRGRHHRADQRHTGSQDYLHRGQADSVLDNRHHRPECRYACGLASVRSASRGKRAAAVRHVVRVHIRYIGTRSYHIQLFQYHAAGDVHDILHHHRIYPHVRHIHSHKQYA